MLSRVGMTYIGAAQHEVSLLNYGWCSDREALVPSLEAELHNAVEPWMRVGKARQLEAGCSNYNISSNNEEK